VGAERRRPTRPKTAQIPYSSLYGHLREKWENMAIRQCPESIANKQSRQEGTESIRDGRRSPCRL